MLMDQAAAIAWQSSKSGQTCTTNLFGNFCCILLTREVKGPGLSLVVIETGIVAGLDLQGSMNNTPEDDRLALCLESAMHYAVLNSHPTHCILERGIDLGSCDMLGLSHIHQQLVLQSGGGGVREGGEGSGRELAKGSSTHILGRVHGQHSTAELPLRDILPIHTAGEERGH